MTSCQEACSHHIAEPELMQGWQAGWVGLSTGVQAQQSTDFKLCPRPLPYLAITIYGLYSLEGSRVLVSVRAVHSFKGFSPNSLLLGVLSWKKELATLTGCAPELCGSSCPLWLGSVPRPCPPLVLYGWALSSSCPPLVLVLAAPLNSVAGLCGPVYWRGVWSNK